MKRRAHIWKCQKCGEHTRTRRDEMPRRRCRTCPATDEYTYVGYRRDAFKPDSLTPVSDNLKLTTDKKEIEKTFWNMLDKGPY